LYYRCAFQRFDEAKILRKAEQTTIGSVYLAGYGIECVLKALILNALTPAKEVEMFRSFRGNKAHDFEWLREQYLRTGGGRFPPAITRSFTLVSDWSTEIRYVPRSMRRSEIDVFLRASEEILVWADGRL